MTSGQVVLLNGVPRSGKSSIAAALQDTSEEVWMHLGVDLLMQATPARLQPGIGLRPGGERPDLEPLVVAGYAALYDSIGAHARQGLHVVADVGHHHDYSRPLGIVADAARRLAGLRVLFVGIRCPLEVVLERRAATGYPTGADEAGMRAIERWQQAVHDGRRYDLELDTSTLTPQQAADEIRRVLSSGREGSAFHELAG